VAIQKDSEKQSTGLFPATAFGLAAKGLNVRNDGEWRLFRWPLTLFVRHHRFARALAGQTRRAQCLAACVKSLSVVRSVSSWRTHS